MTFSRDNIATESTRWRPLMEMLMNEPRLLERQITNNQTQTLTLSVIFVLILLRTRSLVSVGTYFGEKVLYLASVYDGSQDM